MTTKNIPPLSSSLSFTLSVFSKQCTCSNNMPPMMCTCTQVFWFQLHAFIMYIACHTHSMLYIYIKVANLILHASRTIHDNTSAILFETKPARIVLARIYCNWQTMNRMTTVAAVEDKNENGPIHIVTPKRVLAVPRMPTCRPATMTMHKCLCKCRGECVDEGKEDTLIIVLPKGSFHISRERYLNLMQR